MVKNLPARAFRSALKVAGVDRKYDGLKDYLYDFRRFRTHSSALDPEASPEAVSARITKEYHRIEKGLALPEPRPGFALAVVDWLMRKVPRHEAAGHAGLATRGARGSIRAWVDHHDRIGAPVREDIRAFAQGAESLPGGVITLTREEILAATSIDFARFARARHSVRQFTGAPVAEEVVRAAVALALKTPRVCNRESRRVRAAFTPEAMKRMLDHQNGNRGFGHLAGAVLMITSDMRHFTDFGERNQCWVDGGMFAMSLANALHAQGLGTCMLNSATVSWKDQGLRRALGVPDHEAVITFMAVGQLPERIELAESPAPGAGEVLTILA